MGFLEQKQKQLESWKLSSEYRWCFKNCRLIPELQLPLPNDEPLVFRFNSSRTNVTRIEIYFLGSAAAF